MIQTKGVCVLKTGVFWDVMPRQLVEELAVLHLQGISSPKRHA